MRASTAYLAGIGTVAAAITIGLGGGLTIANIIYPHPDKAVQTAGLEQHPSKPPTPAADSPTTPVPYLAAIQPDSVARVPAQAEPRTEAANSAPAPSPTAQQEPAHVPVTASVAKPDDTPAAPPAAVASTAREHVAKPEGALAKVPDSDLKPVGRNRSERRQQWADRRRHESRQSAQLSVEEPVEVSDDGEPREHDKPRIEFPQIRLFGSE